MAVGIRWIWRGVVWGICAVLLSGAGFLVLAHVSAVFPVAGRAQVPAPGPAIYLCAGMAHTDFAVPLALARADAFGPIAAHAPANLPEDTYVMMGWGDYRFFTEVPTLSELRPQIAVAALAGRHETALRVQLIAETSLRAYCRALPLDRDGQAAIAAHIRGTIAVPQTVLPESEFGRIYLRANRRYGVFHTCNDWTKNALRKAGLPVARFNAPFAYSVTRPLQSVLQDRDETADGARTLSDLAAGGVADVTARGDRDEGAAQTAKNAE
ncbi:MAG: DUF2459 domain-containing protein [Pseudomonadota bacterium]